eukprot:gnl/TRDRNA2_/TRDRNA2_161621_c0_seq3.p1 gnl/TRDRNA2_/TRDRNA2_161621_c0~~gnl/TRDRNA2_/TRDRNA2_161621_c0_seq3.p1  ORF type:complete len:306 (+),score=35.07 gnl/TRDRNA2_/TRDRNA2_161621_c0_seq3:51-920(+)
MAAARIHDLDSTARCPMCRRSREGYPARPDFGANDAEPVLVVDRVTFPDARFLPFDCAKPIFAIQLVFCSKGIVGFNSSGGEKFCIPNLDKEHAATARDLQKLVAEALQSSVSEITLFEAGRLLEATDPIKDVNDISARRESVSMVPWIWRHAEWRKLALCGASDGPCCQHMTVCEALGWQAYEVSGASGDHEDCNGIFFQRDPNEWINASNVILHNTWRTWRDLVNQDWEWRICKRSEVCFRHVGTLRWPDGHPDIWAPPEGTWNACNSDDGMCEVAVITWDGARDEG